MAVIRWLESRGLLLSLFTGLLVLWATQTFAQTEKVYVENDWALKPHGLGPGKEFRLLLITSGKKDARNGNIDAYNKFVQTEVATGHSGIKKHSAKFRALASTRNVDARDNVNATGTGIPIYWVNGHRVADNYTKFWNEAWTNKTNGRDQSGSQLNVRHWGSNPFVWTGTIRGGTKHASHFLGAGTGRYGRPHANPISDGNEPGTGQGFHFYALSPVFEVRGTVNLGTSNHLGYSKTSITEGKTEPHYSDRSLDELTYYIQISPAPTTAVPVNIRVHLSDDKVANFLKPSQEGVKSVAFTSGGRKKFEIPTQADPFTDVDGTITLEIKEGELPPTFEFASDSLKKFSFTVKNDPAITHHDLSITTLTPSINEGTVATFELLLDKPWDEDQPLQVDVDVSVGDAIYTPKGHTGTRQVSFRKGAKKATLTVETRINAISEESGKIEARITKASKPIRQTGMKDAEVSVANVEAVSRRIMRARDVRVKEGQSFYFDFKLDVKSTQSPSVKAQLISTELGLAKELTADLSNDLSVGGNFATKRWDLTDGRTLRLGPFDIKNDSVYEFDEKFALRLTEPVGLVLGDESPPELIVTATIDDSADIPELTIRSGAVNEGNSSLGGLYVNSLEYVLSINRPSFRPVQVYMRDTKTGTATTSGNNADVETIPSRTIALPIHSSTDRVLPITDKQVTKTVKVQIDGDPVPEPNETVVIRFNRLDNAVFKDGHKAIDVTGTILNDDRAGRPYLSISEAGLVNEGEEAVFALELLKDKGGKQVVAVEDINVGWKITPGPTDGTGADFSDLVASADNQIIKIKKGSNGARIVVQTKDDSIVENDESFNVSLIHNGSDTTKFSMPLPADAIKTATITDKPSAFISDAEKITEGTVMAFPVDLGVASTVAVTITWKTIDGSAKAGKDYTEQSNEQLVIPAGKSEGTIKVPTTQDTVDEADEDLSVEIVSVSGGLKTRRGRAVGIIRDDDPRPNISIADASVTEGGATALQVSLSTASEKELEVSWATQNSEFNPHTDARAGIDYTAAKGMLTFAAGDVKKEITVQTLDDDLDERDEYFSVLLFHNPEGKRHIGKATVTIVDDESTYFSIEDAPAVKETAGGARARFKVNLSRALQKEVSVEWATLGGNGQNPAIGGGSLASEKDFEVGGGTLKFVRGQTKSFIEVTVNDDQTAEHTETYRVLLGDPVGGPAIKRATAYGEIIDDDAIRYWFEKAGAEVEEGERLTVKLRRNKFATEDHTFRFCLKGINGNERRTDKDGGTATISNYSTSQGGRFDGLDDVRITTRHHNTNDCIILTSPGNLYTKTLSPTDKEITLTVRTIEDDRLEGDETFTLASGTGTDFGRDVPLVLNRPEAVFTIVDDEIRRIKVQPRQNSVWEGNKVIFDLFVEPALEIGKTATVEYSTTDGTATGGSDPTKHDYKSYSNEKVTLNSPTSTGDPAGTLEVQTYDEPLSDSLYESDETFTITLSNPSANLGLPPNNGHVLKAIIKDDDLTDVKIADAIVDEGKEAKLEIVFSAKRNKDATISWETVELTNGAESPADFTSVSAGSASIKAGHTTTSVRVSTKSDRLIEGDEDFQVRITAISLPSFEIGQAATVTIRDDDQHGIMFSGISGGTIEENKDWISSQPVLTGSPFGAVSWTTEGEDASDFSIDTKTGKLTLAAQNYEQPRDSDKDREYEVTIRSTDEDGNTDSKALTVDVTDVRTAQVRAHQPQKTVPEHLQPSFGLARQLSSELTPVTFSWRTVPDDGKNPAGENDYKNFEELSKPQKVTWNPSLVPGGWVKTFDVLDDGIDELDETIRVVVTDLSDGETDDAVFVKSNRDVIASGQLEFVITIQDNDPTTVTLGRKHADGIAEDGGSEEITISLGRELIAGESIVVPLTVSGAIVNTHYTLGLKGSGGTGVSFDTSSPHSSQNPAVSFSGVGAQTAVLSLTAVPNTDVMRRTVAIEYGVDDGTNDRTPKSTGTGLHGGIAPTGSVSIPIKDDDAMIVVAPATAAEGSAVRFTVTLPEAAPAGGVRIGYATADGRGEASDAAYQVATAAADYTAAAAQASLTIAAGAKTGTISVATLADDSYEGDHYFRLTLASTSLYNISAAAGSAVGTITDAADAPRVAFASAASTVAEGVGTVSLTVEKSGTTLLPATVSYATTDGTAAGGSDYTAVAATDLVFAAADTRKTITVAVTNDRDDELTEAFSVGLTAKADAVVGAPASHALSITDDDATTVALSGSATALAENGGAKTLTVTLGRALRAGERLAVPLTLGGTATLGSDYVLAAPNPLPTGVSYAHLASTDLGARPPTLTFTGATNAAATATVRVTAVSDAEDEAAAETVSVALGTLTPTNLDGGASKAGTVSFTISDDDGTPTATLAFTRGSINESGAGNATDVTARLSAVTYEAVTFTVSVPAEAPVTQTGATLTIAAGATASTGKVTLTAIDNDVDAPASVAVSATAAGAGVVDPAAQTLTIVEDDERGVTVSATTLTLVEADVSGTSAEEHKGTYTVVLDSEPTGTVEVGLSVPPGAPFTVSAATLAFTASTWGTAQTVTVTALDDTLDNDKDVRSAAITHTVSAADTDYEDETAAQVQVTVNDDDGTPTATLILTPPAVAESGVGNVSTVTAELSRGSHAAVVLDVAVAAVAPAVVGDVRVSANKRLTIAAGATASTGAVTLTAVNNAADAVDKAFTVSATATGGGIATPAARTLTVVDDDATQVTLARVGSGSIAEAGGTASFTLTLGRALVAGERVTVPLAVSGATVTTHYALGLSGSGGTGVSLDVTDPHSAGQPAVILSGAGARVATLTLTAVATTDTVRRTVAIGYGTSARAPSSTGLSGGIETTGSVSIPIKDDDAMIVVAPATAAEGSAVRFTVTLPEAAPAGGVRIGYATADGRGEASDAAYQVATAAADYTAAAAQASLTIAAGAKTGTISVATLADDSYEGDHYFRLTLASTSLYNISAAAGSAVGTITDAADAPRVAFASAASTVAEGVGTVSLTVEKSGTTLLPATVSYATTDGTAAGGSDYTAVAATDLVFAAADTRKTITVAVTNDRDDELTEAFSVGLTAKADAVVGAPASHALSITDDDATTVALSGSATALAENGGAKTLTVTLGRALRAGERLAVPLTLGGTATLGSDYVLAAPNPLPTGVSYAHLASTDLGARPPTLTFTGATNAAATATVRVTAVSDAEDEAAAETVSVALGTLTPTNLDGGASKAGTVSFTISDDDGTPTATLAFTRGSINESGAGNATDVTARLSAVTYEAVTFTVSVPAEAPVTQTGATLTIAAGATASTGKVTLTAIDNDVDAPASVAVSATAAGAGVVDPAAQTLTIVEDDERGVTVSATTLTLVEADVSGTSAEEHKGTYTVVLDSEPTGTVEVGLSVPPGAPFTVSAATLAFTASTWGTAQTVTVTALDDTLDNDKDVRSAAITHTVSAADTDYEDETAAQVQVTVNDDDGTPTATLILTPPAVAESGVGNVSTVTAELSRGSHAAVVLDVAVAAVAPAVVGDVRVSANKRLTIAAGATASTGAVTLTAVNNAADAVDKAFTVSATATGGGIAAPAARTLTVVDDDATQVTLARVGSGSIAEAGGTASFTLTLGRALVAGERVTVPLAVSGATVTTHYALGLSGSGGTGVSLDVTDPHSAGQPAVILSGAGARVATLTLTAVATTDTVRRTVAIGYGTSARAPSSTGLSGGIETTGSVSIPIKDDDAMIVVAPATAAEGSAVRFTVTLPEAAPAGGVRIGYATADGRGEASDAAYQVATAAADYTAAAAQASLTIAAGAKTGTISVATLADDSYEGDHYFRLTLASTSLYNISAAAGSAVGTITDAADAPRVAFASAASTVAEGVGTVSLTVEKSGTTLLPATVSYATTDGTAAGGSDYTAVAATDLVFAAADTRKTITVAVTNDRDDELTEAFSVGLTAKADAVVGAPASHALSITDDDATTVALSGSATALAENGGAKTLTVTLGRALRAGERLAVPLTLGGTATLGSDYVLAAPNPLPTGVSYAHLASTDLGARPPTLTFTGATNAAATATVRVTAVSDAEDEAAAETVSVALGTLTPTNLDGGASKAGTVSFTISDDDGTPTATLAFTRGSINESGAGNATDVTARLSAVTYEAVTFTVSVPAEAPVTQTGATLTIAAGATASTGKVTLTAIDNDVDAPASVAVSATAAGAGVVDPAAQTLTIVEDDERGVTVSATTLTLVEADVSGTSAEEHKGTYTVVLDSEPTGTVEVGLSVPPGAPFTVSAATLAFTASTWGTAQTVTVTALDDTLDNDKDVRSAAITHTVSAADTDYEDETAAQVQVTVNDDDGTPTATLILTPPAVAESGVGNVSTVTAELSRGSHAAVVLDVAVAAVAPAVVGDVRVSANKRLTIAAGATASTGAVTLTAVNNAADAVDKAFTVSATATGGGIATPAARTLTVVDDDATQVTLARVGSGSIAEAGGTASFTLTLGRALVAGERVTVPLAVSGATVTTHYALGLSGSGGTGVSLDVTDPHSAGQPAVILSGAGARVATLTLTAVATTDTVRRTVAIGYGTSARAPSSTGLSGGIETTGSVSIPIKDDDAMIVVAPATAAEGSAVRFTVTLPEAAPAGGVRIGYATADGRGEASDAAYQVATAAADYTAAAAQASLTIAAGAKTGTISVATLADDSYEGDHYFRLTLASTSLYNISAAAGSAVGTITDAADAPRVAFASAASTVAEGVGTVSLTVEKSGTTLLPATVSYATTDGTAAGGSDYTAVAATDLVFAAADTRKTITVAVTNDRDDELTEAFSVGLTAKADAVVGAPASHALSITDDDATTVALSGSATALAENGGAKTLTVTLGRALRAGERLAVPLTLGGTATLGSDYVLAAPNPLPTGVSYAHLASTDLGARPPTLTFTGGTNAAATATVRVTAVSDAEDEAAAETVSVALGTLTPTNLDGGASKAGTVSFTISDDDGTPTATLAFTRGSINESGAGNATDVTARLSAVTYEAVTFTVSVPAEAPVTQTGATLTIAAGATASTGKVTLTAIDNDVDAPASVAVSATAAGAGVVDPAAQTLTIVEDDERGVTVSATTLTLVEADVSGTSAEEHKGTYTVVLDSEPTGTVEVGLSVPPGAPFTVSAATLAFTASTWGTAQTVTVTALDDTLDNDKDVRSAAITHTVSAADTDYEDETAAQVQVTVNDDDGTPTATLILTPPAVAESGVGNVSTVTAELSRGSHAAVVLDVAVAAVAPAVVGDVRVSANKRLTIAAGATASTGAVTLTAVNNAADAVDKAFTVSATATGGGIATPAARTLTVVDDDATQVTLARVGSGSIAEAGGTASFTLTLGRALVAGERVTVPLAVSGATVTTHYALGLSGSGGTGVSLDVTDPHSAGQPAVILSGAGARVATLTLTAVATTDTVRRTVAIGYGTSARAPSSTGLSGGIETTGSVSIPIKDDDAMIVVAPATAAEGSAVRFTVTLPEAAPAGGVRIGYATADGRGEASDAAYQVATAAADYTAAAAQASLTIAAGAKTGTISVATLADDSYEGDHYFRLTLASTSLYNISAAAGSAVGTITDAADAPRVAFASAASTVAEGVGTVSLTVEKSGTTLLPATVSYATTDGTAAGGSDYTAVAATDLVFAAADTRKTITVAVTNDRDDELTEAFSVGLTAKADAVVGAPASHALSITDDDATTVALSGSATALAENGGAKTLTVTLGRALRAGERLAVPLTLGGTATLGSDYVLAAPNPLPTGVSYAHLASTDLGARPPTLTFTGATNAAATATVRVTAVSDAEDEAAAETVSVALGTLTPTNLDGGASKAGTVSFTISDDDDAPTPTLVLTNSIINESGTGNSTTVTGSLSAPTSADVTITVTIPNGAPLTQTGTKLSFASGATSSTGSVTLIAEDNDIDAADVRVIVSGIASGGGVANPASQTLTIRDDDTRGISVAPQALTLDEADDPSTQAVAENEKTYAIELMSEPTDDVTIGLTTTSSAPFTLSHSSVTFTPSTWDQPRTITVTATNDTTDNANDRRTATITHTVSASGTDYTSETADDVAVTVLDNDGASTLTISSPSITEGDTSPKVLTFAVTLTPASGKVVTVQYADSATGTATSGTDYVAINSGTLTFVAGESEKSISVAVIGDTVTEQNETIVMRLSSASNALLDGGSTSLNGTGTIQDNDDEPTGITLSATPDSLAEDAGKTTIAVTATLDGNTQFPDNTTISVTVGTQGDSAISGTDYSAVSAFNISIPAGATSGTTNFALVPQNDTIHESTEQLTISGTSGALNVTPEVISIVDDETAPSGATLSLSRYTIKENAGATQITVTATLIGSPRSEETELTISVDAGTAQTADFQAVKDFTLTIHAGASAGTQTFTFTPVNDAIDELEESVVVSGTSTLASFEVSSVALHIQNYDPPASQVKLTVQPSSISESGGAQTINVTASYVEGIRPGDAALTVSVAGNTATVGDDFTSVSDFTLTIPATKTQASGSFTLTPVNDAIAEGNETVSVSGSTTITDLTIQSATVNIIDDDKESVSVDLWAYQGSQERGWTEVFALLSEPVKEDTAIPINIDIAAVDAWKLRAKDEIVVPAGFRLVGRENPERQGPRRSYGKIHRLTW